MQTHKSPCFSDIFQPYLFIILGEFLVGEVKRINAQFEPESLLAGAEPRDNEELWLQ